MAMVLKQPEVSISVNESQATHGSRVGAEKDQIHCGCLWLASTVGGIREGPEKSER